MTIARVTAGSAPAALGVRRRSWILLSLAAVSAITACAFDLVDRLVEHGEGEHIHVYSRCGAAVFAVCAGVAAFLAFRDRARRDEARRSSMNLLAFGLLVLWGGQAVGYLLTATSEGVFNGATEQVPLLLSLPLIAVALLRICWPSGMTARDRRTAIVDATVAVLAFAVVWWGFVVPHWVYPDPATIGWERLDQVIMFGLAATILVIAAVSRRIGGLPFVQLMLLLSGLAVQVMADAAGQLFTIGDESSSITWSILGYTVAAALLVTFAHRPALEVETPRQRAARELVSVVVPLAMVLPAGLLLILAAADLVRTDIFLGAGGVLAVATVVVTLLSLILARFSAANELRRIQDEGVATVLAVRTREGWFRALVGDTSEAVAVLDTAGRALWASPRFERDADLPVGEDSWRLADILVDTSADDVALLLAAVATDASHGGPYDLLVRGRTGAVIEMEAIIRPIADVEFQGYVLTARDVSDTRRLARQLANSRRRDDLTGLLSREAFLAECAEQLSDNGVEARVAVVALDLDRFAALNDGMGHETGDMILAAVAGAFDRLPDFVVAASRLGSDTFALLVVDDDPEKSVAEALEQSRADLRGLVLPDGREVELAFHAGFVVTDPEWDRTAEWHVEAADLALARSRSSRNARLVRYDTGMRVETERRLAAENRLRRALAEDRIETYFQPVVRLSDGGVTGAEALARLRDDGGRILPPADFIPLAEEIGLIEEIGEAVLATAVRETMRLTREIDRPLHVAVNVAADQLTPRLVSAVDTVLAREMLPPQRLTIEVTESTLADRPAEAAEVLATLRGRGVVVALDDFGTGYSSLSYLATLPVDGLKIDKSFVSVMGSSRQGLMLSRLVVQLAASLDLRTVAEGVETIEQADLLRGMGCDYAQGYLYARPMPVEQYADYLRGPVPVIDWSEL